MTVLSIVTVLGEVTILDFCKTSSFSQISEECLCDDGDGANRLIAAAMQSMTAEAESGQQLGGMEQMQFAEGAVKEFLLFRGFTATLHSFEAELHSDVSSGFKVDRILDLIFKSYVPQFEAEKLVNLFAFLNTLFVSSADVWLHQTAKKLEGDVKRYYIVHALQKDRSDRVVDFFEHYGDGLLRTDDDDWPAWFCLPYMKDSRTSASFQVYFSIEWLKTLQVSLHNFLCEVFEGLRLPSLLKLGAEKSESVAAKKELEQLQKQNLELHKSLRIRDEEISSLRRGSPLSSCHSLKKLVADFRMSPPTTLQFNSSGKSIQGSDCEAEPEAAAKDESQVSSWDSSVGKPLEGTSPTKWQAELRKAGRARKESITTYSSNSEPERADFEHSDAANSLGITGEASQISVQYQETFSGHTSAITRSRYSSTGANIASASADGTVRIWTPDVAAATSRNATIMTGAEVLSLEWDHRSDRLLLLGTAERNIKAWNVEAKRVVCDLTTEAMFPRVLDLKCSPTDSVFCCAAASEINAHGEGVDGLGYGSLTIWNMRTWKAMTSLALGQEPPVMTSVCFNQNGKILAAGATDGMIRIFDLRENLPIKGWRAHDGCAVSCVRFGHDQASIFSLGADGKILEWSLHNQGQVLQKGDASSYCALGSGVLPRHEFAIDSGGRHLLLTSNLTTAPLYQWGSSMTQTSLEHTAPVTSVDWHPSLPMFLTGSADHSVRVTAVG